MFQPRHSGIRIFHHPASASFEDWTDVAPLYRLDRKTDQLSVPDYLCSVITLCEH